MGPDRYASAGGVVASPAGDRVLLLRRPGRAGPDGRSEMRLPKGHIEPGESREQTALREVAEETGLGGLEIAADLGHQIVEYDWRGRHYVRDESYFLMRLPPGARPEQGEPQFVPVWLDWDEALEQVTFEAERDWLKRAREELKTSSHRPVSAHNPGELD